MNRRVSIFLIILAILGVGWMCTAAYWSLMPSADVARLHSGLAEESPSQVDKSNDPVDNHGPLEPGPAAESASTDSNSIRPPLPVVDPSDAPKPQAEAVRYQEKMQLGAARASLLLETPLEWLQQYLRSVASVDSLGVQPGALTPEAVDVIAESGNVKHMDFSAVHLMSNEASSALSRLSEVESIGISTNRPYSSNSGPVEEELNPFIQPLLSMPDLKTLSIGGAINDELLRMISELGRLETLRLENNNDLRRYDKITTAGIMYLSRLSGLKELVMINFTVGRHRIDLDRLTDLLYGFPGLERLSLAGWTMADKHLAPCSFVLCRLSYLNLNNTDITDGFYRNIDATWMLEELSAPGIGDKGLQAVASAPNLKRLSAGERVTDVGVEFLAENAHGLEALCIERAAITDDSLIALQQCQSLRELSVRFTANITLAGLKQLCEARQLEILDTSGNKFVTRTVVEELLSVSPSLKTLIHYPYSVLTNGDRQKLMSDFPEVTIAPFPLTSQWYR